MCGAKHFFPPSKRGYFPPQFLKTAKLLGHYNDSRDYVIS